MSRSAIFPAEANPAIDAPRCYASSSTIARKLAAGSIREVAPHGYQEISLNHRRLDRWKAESGYDVASRRGIASEMQQVWQPRTSSQLKVWQMGVVGKARTGSSTGRIGLVSNGWPDRLSITDREDIEVQVLAPQKLPPGRVTLSTEDAPAESLAGH